MSDEPTLYDLLHCPETHRELLPVTKKWVDRLNARIRAGEIRDAEGREVTEVIEDGFVTDDDRYLYPVRDRIPNLFLSDRLVLHDAGSAEEE